MRLPPKPALALALTAVLTVTACGAMRKVAAEPDELVWSFA